MATQAKQGLMPQSVKATALSGGGSQDYARLPSHSPMLRKRHELGNQAMQHLLHSRIAQADLSGTSHEDSIPVATVQRPQLNEASPRLNTLRAGIESPRMTAATHPNSLAFSNPYRSIATGMRAAGKQESSKGASGIRLRSHYFNGEHGQAVDLVQTNKGPGTPLSPVIQSLMKKRLGHDFSDVRIHLDAFAAHASTNLDANAFTVKRDIFFGQNQYAPERPDGLLRLAHELTHTIQQTGASRPSVSQINDLEMQAEHALMLGTRGASTLSRVGPIIMREPTYPRRATGRQMVREAERVLNLTRDEKSTDELTAKWSAIDTNFSGSITAGSIARRIWTHLFLRHFTEADTRPGVESAHPRYLFSQVYGWIDAQHFFGFIDYAEQNLAKNEGDQQKAFDAATKKGLEIEQNQQKVRDKVVFGRPAASGVTRLMQVRPPNTSLFRSPQMAASVAATSAATLFAVLGGLTGTERQLFFQLDSQQRQKFFTDTAKSAFTYEDFQSNQLGTRFFFQHGIKINGLAPAAREPSFISALSSFFSGINIENDQKSLDDLAKNLPGKERFEAPKTTEDAVRQKHPDLFKLPPP
jgi:hypothetical protein